MRKHRTLFLLVATLLFPAPVWAETALRLRNGYMLRGTANQIIGLNQNSFAAAAKGNDPASFPVVVVDDGLKRCFVYNRGMVAGRTDAPDLIRRINLWQQVARSTNEVGAIGSQTTATPFNAYGRRWVTTQTPEGPLRILQGITEINARYVQIQGLQTEVSYGWDMRVSTNTIPAATLQEIFEQAVPRDDLDGRLDVVNFFIEAERFPERQELLAVIEDFPEADQLPTQLQALTQREARQILDEAMVRRDAGQYRLALAMLRNFLRVKGIARVTRLEAQDLITAMTADAERAQSLLDQLREQVGQLPAAQAEGLAEFVDQMQVEMSPDTLSRLSDYERLGSAEGLPLESRVALGIGGWLLGPGSGMQNLAIARSLITVRQLVSEYLATDDPNRREAILRDLEDQEGAEPAYVAKLLAMLPPPLPLPLTVAEADPTQPAAETAAPKSESPGPAVGPDQPNPDQPNADQPNADETIAAEDVAAEDAPAEDALPGAEQAVPGYFEITVDTVQGPVVYSVQLPPEYHPLRKYPAILALHPLGVSAKGEIDWWSGVYNAEMGMRVGQASRQGYVVIAPVWTREGQAKYEYTPIEHHRVLSSLRDALRRVSIDTDRVYLAGHLGGASAAWDIALAHPDLWAGLLSIGGDAGKYVLHYAANGKYVPMYHVTGEIAGSPSPLFRNGAVLDDYMAPGYDALVTLYRGRGDELFYEDINNMFDWMRLSSHRRPAIPREIEAATMREGDNFFWWLELTSMLDTVAINPILYEHVERKRAGQIGAKVLDGNSIRVTTAPSRSYDILLTPEMGIDINQPVSIRANSRNHTYQFDGSIRFMLEDARRRADRQHVFWAKVSVQ